MPPISITPSLSYSSDLVHDAVVHIEVGGTMLVGDLDTARDILKKLGMTDADIAKRIHFALTGELRD